MDAQAGMRLSCSQTSEKTSFLASRPILAKHPYCGTKANSADPDQTLQNPMSDQGLHCLFTEFSITM